MVSPEQQSSPHSKVLHLSCQTELDSREKKQTEVAMKYVMTQKWSPLAGPFCLHEFCHFQIPFCYVTGEIALQPLSYQKKGERK